MTTRDELPGLFAAVCNSASRGEKVTAIHLFGVNLARLLKDMKMSELNEIARLAGQSPKYGTELRKMVRLSEFVEVKTGK